MKCTTEWEKGYRQCGRAAHRIALLGLVILIVIGIRLENVEGLVACPPQLRGKVREQCKVDRGKQCGCVWQAGWSWLRKSWMVAAVRSEALMVLVFVTGCEEWDWVCVMPWVAWLWKGVGVAWPKLGWQPTYRRLGRVWEESGRVALTGLALTWIGQQTEVMSASGMWGLSVGMVLQSQEAIEPSVMVEQDEEGVYHVRLRGEFEMHVDGQVEFYQRMLIVFLGLLEVPGETRRSRRTRDGRTPFCRQEQMAAWFGVTHPEISRWYDYWLRRDWRRMLSQRTGEVLTLEVQQRIVDTWAKFPWWGTEWLWNHLRSHGSRVTLNQVKQVARESGWSVLRQALSRVYVINVESFRPRDKWLVQQLLAHKSNDWWNSWRRSVL